MNMAKANLLEQLSHSMAACLPLHACMSAGASVASPSKPKAKAVGSGSKPGTSSAPNGPHHTSLPSDAIPLVLRNGAVVSDTRGVLLDALPTTATAASDSSSTDHGALVLGLRSSDGVTSLIDMCLGQVRL